MFAHCILLLLGLKNLPVKRFKIGLNGAFDYLDIYSVTLEPAMLIKAPKQAKTIN